MARMSLCVHPLGADDCGRGMFGRRARRDDDHVESRTNGHAPRATVALITHQAPGDTFWDLVRRGAEAAAAKDDIDLRYSHDPDAAAQANLVRSAVNGKVAGIAVTLADPAVMAPAVQSCGRRGNSRCGSEFRDQPTGKRLGVMEYFGQDETIAGQAAGRTLHPRRRAERHCV